MNEISLLIKCKKMLEAFEIVDSRKYKDEIRVLINEIRREFNRIAFEDFDELK